MKLLPSSVTSDAKHLVAARTVRSFADGVVSVLLASYLTALGFSPVRVGLIVTSTLLGSALLTLWVGLRAGHVSRRTLLLFSSGLMFATGLGFIFTSTFWPLFVIAFVGTLNPSAGDVSLFLPTEQAALSGTVEAKDRTSLFARYNVFASFTGALGALASGVPAAVAHQTGRSLLEIERLGFVLYASAALVAAWVYWGLSPAIDRDLAPAAAAPLRQSRRLVFQLSALFSLDAFGGGFVVQSLLVLWLYRRFHLSVETAATVFFFAGVLSSLSQLVSPWLAKRIGLIETMVFTHLPGNLCLAIAALMPTAPLAIFFLLARMCVSQMDVPARQSYVMAMVPPEERPAAATLTNVPRSLASAMSPLIAGWLLSISSIGWPLLCAGLLKAVYDVALYVKFQAARPKEA